MQNPTNRIVLIVSSTCFTCCLQGGTYVFQIIDYYTSTWSVIYIAFFEVIAVSWMYGGNKMAADIERITGMKPLWFFKFSWYITTPLSLMVNYIYIIIILSGIQ